MSHFSVQARGCATTEYAEKLAAECTAYWQAGRQMCEELSLTGNNCTNRKHIIHGQSQPDGGKNKKFVSRSKLYLFAFFLPAFPLPFLRSLFCCLMTDFYFFSICVPFLLKS